MKSAIILTVLGLVWFTIGLALSPLPWLALCVPGATMFLIGLLKDS